MKKFLSLFLTIVMVFSIRSARKVRILANPGMLWTLDGEREEGHWEVMAENVHHAIHLVKKVDDND